MIPVDATRLDLAHELKANPFGPHGAELQQLLKLLRWEPVVGRFLVVQPELDGPYYLARVTGPKGHPMELFRSPAYDTLGEAYWTLFRQRWEQHTGTPLILDDTDGDVPAEGDGEVGWHARARPILGYSDKFSVENGQSINFKVSAKPPGRYSSTIKRIRSGDRNHVGLKTTAVETPANADYPARMQPIEAGSYIECDDADGFSPESFALTAFVWPTTPAKRRQALLGTWNQTAGRGYGLMLDETGSLMLMVGNSNHRRLVATGVPLMERQWCLVAASFDAVSGQAWVGQRPLNRFARGDTAAGQAAALDIKPTPGGGFRMAAWSCEGGRRGVGGLYNGKIDSPVVMGRALLDAERAALLDDATVPDPGDALVAGWDFSRDISSVRVTDGSPHGRHGETVNLPTRAMKGWNWDGSEYNWVHKPEHYGAIHFHDDDLYDCGWHTDFTFTAPDDLASGLYCAELNHGGHQDHVPFVVRPPRGTARADLALILPTASYWAYGNHHMPVEGREWENVGGDFTMVGPTELFLHENAEFGCSLYDEHSDGSGVCYSSRLRPLLYTRPGEVLWQLPADTHIIDWLEEKGIAFDVITEDDLEAEGDSLLAPYRCVMTGTHPEYPSITMLDAFASFQNRGGRFIYFGGNGFYWRTSYDPALPGVIEMRRAEDGIRSWAAEGGEYYHSFTGELGGMWRRMGRAPQSVAGAGMAAQGFDMSTYYERTTESFDHRAGFIFEGVGDHERIGDFGHLGDGAAGWEVDRADHALGTPRHALVVASATNFSAAYHWVKEEMTHTHAAITGETCPFVRADMVFYETLNGGAVFSTSSIAWAGSLAHNGYDNNVSRITENVIRRFLDPAPL
ncbi:MAG: N,N-dimethylformamidase beta subunit family domain-containing protein [Alphaproteobacteria bacterium]